MWSLETKAPNFTRENAGEMARRATASREARRAREKALASRAHLQPEPDDARRQKVLNQIDIYLDDMKGASIKERLAIGKAVADLWKLVQSVPGQARKSSRRAEAPAMPEPMPTPQAPTSAADEPNG